jgi:hypothetical protein|tara:strand:- start:1307 stop:2275 length:969 start_codon:yes stop_codon:yes gene_type:complete
MSNYFSYIPDVFVRTKSYRTGVNDPYVLAKNIFRRIKIRDDLSDVILGFEKYTIQNNERPDQVAEKVYGNVNYDWVLLLVNNIINVYDEWPMTEQELYNYMVRKYGKDEVESIHHWETQEIRSTRGDIQLRAGFEVTEDFQYMRPDGTMVPKAELIRPLSNYDYESGLNDYKRGIHVLKPQFLNAFVEEFEELVDYLPSNEVDPLTGIKRSVATVAEAFTSVKPTYETLVGQTPSIQFAATAEYTSRNFGSSDPTISQGDVLADGSTVAVTVTTGSTTATTETAGEMTETEVNQYGSAGSSSGQTSGGGTSSGGSYSGGGGY